MTLNPEPNRAWGVAILLLLGMWGLITFYNTRPVPLPRDLRSFPTALGEWQGDEVDPREGPFRWAGADEEVARIYLDNTGRALWVYIAYFRSQEQDRELVSWLSKDLHRKATEIEVQAADGHVYRVNRVLLPEGRDHRVLYFWYDLNGRIFANRYLTKLTTLWDGLTARRSNGAVVVVSTMPLGVGLPEEGAEKQRIFLREMLRATQQYMSLSSV